MGIVLNLETQHIDNLTCIYIVFQNSRCLHLISNDCIKNDWASSKRQGYKKRHLPLEVYSKFQFKCVICWWNSGLASLFNFFYLGNLPQSSLSMCFSAKSDGRWEQIIIKNIKLLKFPSRFVIVLFNRCMIFYIQLLRKSSTSSSL